jgi:hypothetical protein
MILAMEAKVAEGSPIGLKEEGSEKCIQELKLLAEGMVKIIVEMEKY